MRHLLALLLMLLLQQVVAQLHSSSIASKPAVVAGIIAAPDSLSENSIPFKMAGNLIILQATADTTTGNFILDTGAPGLVLNLTYFRQYKHAEVSDRSSMSGTMLGAVQTLVDKFRFGKQEYKNLDADMISLGHIEDKKGLKILGLIGLSFFTECEMMIDYEQHLIHLRRMTKKDKPLYAAASPDTSACKVLDFDIVDQKMIIGMKMGDRKMKFFLDSGAESNVLDSRQPNKVFENMTITGRSRMIGAGNKPVEALYGNLANLKLGDQLLQALPFVITNLENACISEVCCIDGILGFNSLSVRRLGFNFIKKEMYLWK